MSRTYRRRKGDLSDRKYYTSKLARSTSGYVYQWVPIPADSKEYKKGIAKFHGDHGTHNFKEPGPSWFRNLFFTRRDRARAREEIAKWIKNPEYEVISNPIRYLPYWT